jgi:CheY-like chemotaxis protein
VVSCTASLLLDDLEAGDPRREDVDAIVSAATRGAALTRKLLTFSRRQVVESVDIDLNELVGQTEAQLREALPAQIDLVLRLEAGDVVRADADRLAQVLLSLVHNARDAISGAGRIVVRTRNVDLDAPIPSRFGAVPEGRYVRLTVEDTGAGMSEETMARIFEPFFTTKRTSGARGLGLSTVYGVIVQAGGHIDVTSRPGEGSCFSIYLPRIDRARETVLDSTRRPVVRPRGTVLVVDDEELVRRSIARVLGREGFTVREAEDGLAALSVLDASEGAIDLLITDAIMPRMGGAALIEQAAVRFPALPILMISGCTDKELVTGELCGRRRAFLTKPVEIPVLLSALDDLLGHGRAPSPPPVPSLCARIA